MKKKITYILIVLVVAIWGGIFVQLFFRTDAKSIPSPVLHKPDIIQDKPTSILSELVLDYPDPFLKDILPKEPVVVTTETDHFIMEETPMNIDWAFITYSGIVSNHNSQRKIGLVIIHGMETMIREGQSIEGIKFIQIQKNYILIEYSNQVQTIQKRQPHNESDDVHLIDGDDYGSL